MVLLPDPAGPSIAIRLGRCMVPPCVSILKRIIPYACSFLTGFVRRAWRRSFRSILSTGVYRYRCFSIGFAVRFAVNVFLLPLLEFFFIPHYERDVLSFDLYNKIAQARYGGLWNDFGKAKVSHQFYAIWRVTVSIYAANVNASLCQVEYNAFFTPWAVGKNTVSMRGAQVTFRGVLCP
jgi:hypothetical protein